MSAPVVDILLPTWNGARYLREQLDSLQAQTFTEWQLLVRDDGSTDDTVALLHAAAQDDARIRVLDSLEPRARLGAAANVSALMTTARAPYTMLCDQDDRWSPDKVVLTLDRLRGTERTQGAHTPVLVHSDLEVVSEELTAIAPSFWQYRSLDPVKGTRFPRLLIRNVAVGCTMGMNAALRTLAAPIPSAAYMHDWWIALVAAAFGEIYAIDRPLLQYRQHGANTIGAGHTLSTDVLRVLAEPQRLSRYYRRARTQTEAFLDRFAPRMKREDAQAAAVFAAGRGGLLRPWSLLNAGLIDSNPLRQLALLAFG